VKLINTIEFDLKLFYCAQCNGKYKVTLTFIHHLSMPSTAVAAKSIAKWYLQAADRPGPIILAAFLPKLSPPPPPFLFPYRLQPGGHLLSSTNLTDGHERSDAAAAAAG
jgi:hypothetical protein